MTRRARSGPAASRPGPRQAEPDPGADRAALAILSALVLLAAARLALTFVPTMWGWGLNVQRFLPSVPGWALWAIATVGLMPPVARALTPWIERSGDAVRGSPRASAVGWGALGALVAWSMPDRLHFVGDFELRLSALESGTQAFARWAHVALPLETLLHDRLVRGLHAVAGREWVDATRMLGAFEAGLLGAAASWFARVARLRGAAAFAACSIVLFGGYLTLFTGYNKAFMETALLTLAIACAGVTFVRDGRGLLVLGLAAAAAFASHRSALALVVPLVAAWWLGRRHLAPPAGRPRSRAALTLTLAAIALPLATLAAMLPGMVAAMKQYDRPHFAPPGAARGLLVATLAPLHLADVANLVILLAPLAIVAPALLVMRRTWRERETRFLLLLALPYTGELLLVHTHQGLFRDLDCFAAAGVALAALTAWLAGRTLDAAPRRGWIAVAVAAGVAVPAVQSLMLPTDLERGLARARAFVSEPPARGAGERAETWDFIGLRHLKLERWADGERAFAHAAESAPSPRILTEQAICAAGLRDYAASESLYRRVIELSPGDLFAWHGLMGSAYQLQHLAQARQAANEVLKQMPDDADAKRVLDVIARVEAAQAQGRK